MANVKILDTIEIYELSDGSTNFLNPHSNDRRSLDIRKKYTTKVVKNNFQGLKIHNYDHNIIKLIDSTGNKFHITYKTLIEALQTYSYNQGFIAPFQVVQVNTLFFFMCIGTPSYEELKKQLATVSNGSKTKYLSKKDLKYGHVYKGTHYREKTYLGQLSFYTPATDIEEVAYLSLYEYSHSNSVVDYKELLYKLVDYKDINSISGLPTNRYSYITEYKTKTCPRFLKATGSQNPEVLDRHINNIIYQRIYETLLDIHKKRVTKNPYSKLTQTEAETRIKTLFKNQYTAIPITKDKFNKIIQDAIDINAYLFTLK